jgi:hypothetical protein
MEKEKIGCKSIYLDVNESELPNLEKQSTKREFKLKENVLIFNNKGENVAFFTKDEIIEDCNIYFDSLFDNDYVELFIDGPQYIESIICTEDQELINEGVSTPMPRYQCNKKVSALKIKSIDFGKSSKSGAYIMPEDRNYSRIYVDSNYLEKHNPKAGGYYVVYKDGYKSYSPAEAFEEGYTIIKN